MRTRSPRRRRRQLEPRYRHGGHHPFVEEGGVAVQQVPIEQAPVDRVASLRGGGGSRRAVWTEAMRAHTCEVASFAVVAAVAAVHTHGSGGNGRGIRTIGTPAAKSAVTMAAISGGGARPSIAGWCKSVRPFNFTQESHERRQLMLTTHHCRYISNSKAGPFLDQSAVPYQRSHLPSAGWTAAVDVLQAVFFPSYAVIRQNGANAIGG